MRGPDHFNDPENGYPAVFQALIARNWNFSTGLLSGFLGVFFQKFLFWALYEIQEVLRRRKPAYLELFGWRIGHRGWGNLWERGFWEPGGRFGSRF